MTQTPGRAAWNWSRMAFTGSIPISENPVEMETRRKTGEGTDITRQRRERGRSPSLSVNRFFPGGSSSSDTFLALMHAKVLQILTRARLLTLYPSEPVSKHTLFFYPLVADSPYPLPATLGIYGGRPFLIVFTWTK